MVRHASGWLLLDRSKLVSDMYLSYFFDMINLAGFLTVLPGLIHVVFLPFVNPIVGYASLCLICFPCRSISWTSSTPLASGFGVRLLSLTYSLDAWLTTNMLAADAHYARIVQCFSLRVSAHHAVVAIVYSYYNNSTNNHMTISLIVVSLFYF